MNSLSVSKRQSLPDGARVAKCPEIRGLYRFLLRARHFPTEHGQALLFVTLSLPVLLGLTGLVVDLGRAFWRQEAAQTAANSAALAGAIVADNASNLTWAPA